MQNLEIRKYFDLYGLETILIDLKSRYFFVSFCKKSIPKIGSLTIKTNELKTTSDAKIEKVIIHKNGNITLKTNFCFLQFFN